MFPLKPLPSSQHRTPSFICFARVRKLKYSKFEIFVGFMKVSRTYIPFIWTKILTLPLVNHYINFWYVNPVCSWILKKFEILVPFKQKTIIDRRLKLGMLFWTIKYYLFLKFQCKKVIFSKVINNLPFLRILCFFSIYK